MSPSEAYVIAYVRNREGNSSASSAVPNQDALCDRQKFVGNKSSFSAPRSQISRPGESRSSSNLTPLAPLCNAFCIDIYRHGEVRQVPVSEVGQRTERRPRFKLLSVDSPSGSECSAQIDPVFQ